MNRPEEEPGELDRRDCFRFGGFGEQAADSENAENDWLGLSGGSSNLALADCGYAPVVAVPSHFAEGASPAASPPERDHT